MDLLEQVRMDDTYERLTSVIKEVGDIGVFPPLVWVWTWDIALSTLRDFEEDDEFMVNMPEKDIFKLFWEQADKNGFTLEYGTDNLYEAIRDWLMAQGVVTPLETANE